VELSLPDEDKLQDKVKSE
jgi:hypothetical protein